jgi:hypothetical protein
MSLKDFKESVTILPDDSAATWRARYIRAFIDVTLDFYKKNIQKLKQCSDGMSYESYLWDCIKNIRPIRFDEFITELNSKPQRVMVMWDLHSCDKIPVEDYWKFGRSDVLLLETPTLAEGLEYLPEDIYVFDDSLRWTLFLTHEYDAEGVRGCGRA